MFSKFMVHRQIPCKTSCGLSFVQQLRLHTSINFSTSAASANALKRPEYGCNSKDMNGGYNDFNDSMNLSNHIDIESSQLRGRNDFDFDVNSIANMNITRRFKSDAFYSNVRQNIKKASTLSSECYTSEIYNECEKEELWKKQWFAVCHIQEMKESQNVKVFDIGNQSYIVTKDKNNKLRAFNNVCPHRGARLCDKDGIRARLTCPYHSWSFGLNGELKACPFLVDKNDTLHSKSSPKQNKENKQNKSNVVSGLKLNEIHICEYGSIIWLNATPINKALPSSISNINDIFGDFEERFENYQFFDSSYVNDNIYIYDKKYYENINCNWKLKMENFEEWYHLPSVHPSLTEISNPEYHYIENGNGLYTSYFTNPITNTGSVTDVNNFNFFSEKLNQTEKQQMGMLVLPPNVQFNVYPHFIYTMIVLPGKKVNTCNEYLYFFMNKNSCLKSDHNDTFKYKCDKIMDFLCLANEEDIEIVKRVQNGMANDSFKNGIFSDTTELCVYKYQNFIADYMTGKFGCNNNNNK